MRILLYVFLIVPVICLSQSISNLESKEDIQNYIINNFKYFGTKYDAFKIYSLNDKKFDSIKYDPFKIGDFNHDGKKDLLVFGEAQVSKKNKNYFESEIAVFLSGKRRDKKIPIPLTYKTSNWFDKVNIFPLSVKKNGKDFIQIKSVIYNPRNQETIVEIDTLTIKFDKVMIETSSSLNTEIDRIDFKTDYCYGTCPVFELKMFASKDVVYNGINHVDNFGKLKMKMDNDDWLYLSSLVKNLKVNELKDNYSVRWTDEQTGYLTVYFKNGEIKKIEDYGLAGNYKLTILYEFLFELIDF